MRRKRSNLKRSSHSLGDRAGDTTDGGVIPTEAVDREAEMTCGEVLEDNNNVNRVKRAEMGPNIEFDTTSLNSQISQRLDSTTDRLRVITQVLADLAVDIHAFKDRQCAIVI